MGRGGLRNETRDYLGNQPEAIFRRSSMVARKGTGPSSERNWNLPTILADEGSQKFCFPSFLSVMLDQEKTPELKPCACRAATSTNWPGQPCVACQGLGKVMVPQPARVCSRCEGTGRARHAQRVLGFLCDACWGSGWMAAVWVKSLPTANPSGIIGNSNF